MLISKWGRTHDSLIHPWYPISVISLCLCVPGSVLLSSLRALTCWSHLYLLCSQVCLVNSSYLCLEVSLEPNQLPHQVSCTHDLYLFPDAASLYPRSLTHSNPAFVISLSLYVPGLPINSSCSYLEVCVVMDQLSYLVFFEGDLEKGGYGCWGAGRGPRRVCQSIPIPQWGSEDGYPLLQTN